MLNTKAEVRNKIRELEEKYKFRPLPKKIQVEILSFYSDNLNGFEDLNKKCMINGVLIAHRFNRICTGHYGSYLEIEPSDMAVRFHIAHGQEWRLDENYLMQRNLNIKYEWYTVMGCKLYYQVDTVKYASYKPGMFYISVLDFD